jgi:hypothetical protein
LIIEDEEGGSSIYGRSHQADVHVSIVIQKANRKSHERLLKKFACSKSPDMFLSLSFLWINNQRILPYIPAVKRSSFVHLTNMVCGSAIKGFTNRCDSSNIKKDKS